MRSSELKKENRALSYKTAILILIFVWGLIIWLVDPRGDFMINDDWSFVKALELLVYNGGISATGWGMGGPSLITHLLWGWLFLKLFGFSVTVLRISVLVMAIIGSFALMEILRKLRTPASWALFGTLTMILNPLFLSQSFSFMTDITCATLMILSILSVTVAVCEQRNIYVVFALFASLLAVLTRQIAIVIPLSLVIATFFHTRTINIKTSLMIFMIMGLVLLPWLVFEYLMKVSGSTPLTNHMVIYRLIHDPLDLGIQKYLLRLLGRGVMGIAYVSLLASPVIVLAFKPLLSKQLFRIYFLILIIIFIFLQLAIFAGIINLKVKFLDNVIFNFGIGPILLKDVSILGLPRTFSIPVPLYYGLVYWAFLNAGALGLMICLSLTKIFDRARDDFFNLKDFTSTFILVNIVSYIGIIVLTGYLDRYLIPTYFLVIIWIINDQQELFSRRCSPSQLVPGLILLFAMGVFSISGVHDFMRTRSAVKQAHDYLMNDLAVHPCDIDGGFEFNGYHCYRKHFVKRPGLSWWWVDRERYVLTLGPLAGYTVEKVFPFRRTFGPGGAIHVLKNDLDVSN